MFELIFTCMLSAKVAERAKQKITFCKFGVISGSVVNLGICTLMVAALYAYHPTGPATLLIHW